MSENETIADIANEFRKLAASSSDGIIAVNGNVIADRIEAACKRELPQPDPDWKAICEKCHDGDILPDCEYFGEPNGCNSPIYGEHPKAKPVGNAAAMRIDAALLSPADERKGEK